MKLHKSKRFMAFLLVCCFLLQSLSAFAAGAQNSVSEWEEHFINERETFSITAEKRDADTDALLAGAVFGLYMAENLLEADGSVAIKAGTLLATAVSDENGQADFPGTWPAGSYRISELQAPDGYTVAADQTVRVSKDTTLVFYDKAVDARITLIKKIPVKDLKEAAEVVTFQLFYNDAEGNEKILSKSLTFTEDSPKTSDGQYYILTAAFTNLELGTYTAGEICPEDLVLQEITDVSNGTVIGAFVEFTLTAAQQTAGATFLNATEPVEAELTLVKKLPVSSYYDPHGAATFLFQVTGTDEDGKEHNYYRSLTFDENTPKTEDGLYYILSASITGMEAGTYTASELPTIRYDLVALKDISTNGTIMKGDTVEFTLSKQQPAGTATFVNEKLNWNDNSHANCVVNVVEEESIGISWVSYGIVTENEAVVIDYDRDVIADVLENTSAQRWGWAASVEISSMELAGLRITKEALPEEWTESLLAGFTVEATGIYGTASLQENKIRYHLSRFLDSTEVIQFAVKYTYADGTVHYVYHTLTVVPANNVYYENDFAGITYTGTEVTDGTETGIKQWKMIIGREAKDCQDFQFADMQGSDVNYGYDSAYTANAGHSNDSVTEMGSTALAKFTFTGTGFDIVSRTNQEAVEVAVMIKPSDTTQKTKMLIHNFYYDDGDLYQIPVISVKNLDYGEYTVQILARYERDMETGQLTTKNQIFYLDGIRIYNPLGMDEVQGNESNNDIRGQYYAYGEDGAEFIEIRNELLGSNRMKQVAITEDADGILRVSSTDAYTTTEWIGDASGEYFQATQTASGLQDYLRRGPNNELYLSPGQSIMFKIENAATEEVERLLQIGAKTPNAEKQELTVKVNGVTTKYDIGTKAEMYYDVTSDNLPEGAWVILANTTDTADNTGFISLTNFKINNYKLVELFEAEAPQAIPDSYAATANINENGIAIYSYNDEYRIYGSYHGTDAAWYACNESGVLQSHTPVIDTAEQEALAEEIAALQLAELNRVLKLYQEKIVTE